MMKRYQAAGILAALAVPALALAQPTVAISGYLKMSIEQLQLGNSAKSPSGEVRLADNSSRIYFRFAEDLGGGLAALGQYEMRLGIDTGALAGTGASWVGLRSARLGTVKFGRADLHYANEPSKIRSRSGSWKASPISLLSFAGGGGSAIASAARTPNVVLYDSPVWSGWALLAAYSSSPAGADADIGSGARKGSGWNVHPSYRSGNFNLGYSYWKQKADGAGAGSDQRGDRLYGAYQWGGFELGAAWDSAKIDNGSTGARTSSRTAWSIPLQYASGPHTVYAHYTKARDDKATAAADGARMWAFAYNYDLSKRTALGLSYARIRNDAGAFYNLDGSAGANGSPSGAVLAGENPRLWAFTVFHAF
jgi:predicted porin